MTFLGPSSPADLTIPAPETLSDDAAVYWRQVVPSLITHDILIDADLPLVVNFCRAMALADRFHAELEGDVDLSGDAVKRTRVGYERQVALALRLAGELGIGPVPRVRLGLMKARGHSLLEHLQRARTERERTKTRRPKPKAKSKPTHKPKHKTAAKPKRRKAR